MASRRRPQRGPGTSLVRTAGTLVLIVVLLAPAGPAAAQSPPAGAVPAIVAAYGQAGTIAVALTRQPGPLEGLGMRAAEAVVARAGARIADNGPAAGHPFPAASMVKLFVAEDILHRARTGGVTLTREDFGLLQAMIRRSDDPAASALWARFGGGRMVVDVAARYGLTGTAPPVRFGQWGLTTTTARDLARFLARLPVTAHPADAAALLVWMRLATPAAADGFDQRFGVLGAAPGRPAVKQGWMCCVGGHRHLHSVGVVGSRVVVLLSEVPRALGYDAARGALTAAAAAVPSRPRS